MIKIMLGSIPHQKLCFYHLPTRGRAGIKLGDAWYISNVSVIFDCSMLLYYPFWIFMGFTLHFYIIFGTNLLAGGPTQIAIFFAYFSVSKKRNVKRSPNGMKPSGELFLEQTQSRRLGVDVKEAMRRPRGRRACPHPRGPLVAPLTYLFRLYILIYPKNIREHHKTLFPPPQPSVPVRSHLGAFSGTPLEGESITEGFYINTIASSMSCE